MRDCKVFPFPHIIPFLQTSQLLRFVDGVGPLAGCLLPIPVAGLDSFVLFLFDPFIFPVVTKSAAGRFI